MSPATLVILIVVLFVLAGTNQIFWVIIAAIVLLAYSLTSVTRSMSRGIKSARKKARDVYKGDIGEMEKVTGKYPARFFDSAGKGIMEKVNEHQAPKGATSYADAMNYAWAIKNPAEKIADIANKIADTLSKLFSK